MDHCLIMFFCTTNRTWYISYSCGTM